MVTLTSGGTFGESFVEYVGGGSGTSALTVARVEDPFGSSSSTIIAEIGFGGVPNVRYPSSTFSVVDRNPAVGLVRYQFNYSTGSQQADFENIRVCCYQL